MGQFGVAAVVAAAALLEAVALDPAAHVVVDGHLVLVPVEGDGALVADEGGAAFGGPAAGVEALRVDHVEAGLVADHGGGRVVVAGVGGEAAQPVVRLDLLAGSRESPP